MDAIPSLRSEKGTVVIYLLIIFTALVIFIGLFIDLARIKAAQTQLRRSMNSSARSVLAGYDSELRGDLGVFVAVEQGAQCNAEFRRYLEKNLLASSEQDFKLLDFKIEQSHSSFSRPLGDDLKRQILEEMKYAAPIELTRSVANKFNIVAKLARDFEEANEKAKKLADINLPLLVNALRVEVQRQNDMLAEDNFTQYNPEDWSQNKPSAKDTADKSAKTLHSVFEGIRNTLSKPTEEIFINEYVLKYFSNSTKPLNRNGYKFNNLETEYVLYATGPEAAPRILKIKAAGELFAVRMALDTVAYYSFSPQAPSEPTARLLCSAVMGSIQASLDVYKLLVSGKAVRVAEMLPESANRIPKNFTLSYKDHLRLFLLLDRGNKIDKIKDLIVMRYGKGKFGKSYTLINGSTTVSIKLWFLPLAGLGEIKNGPFGTMIHEGRCYITKDVELGY